MNMTPSSRNIIEFFMRDPRPVSSCIFAAAGPRSLENETIGDMARRAFSKCYYMIIPSDHGGFPDTSEYKPEDWKKLEFTTEDPSLHRHMLNLLDMVDEYLTKKTKNLVKRGHSEIEGIMHVNTKGGPVFAITGFVKSWPPGSIITPN